MDRFEFFHERFMALKTTYPPTTTITETKANPAVVPVE